jgi:hypothetical protein
MTASSRLRRSIAARPGPAAGFALLASLLLLLLLLSLAAGLFYVVNTEVRLGQNDLENNLAFYGAEAAMEKMMVDVSTLYALPRMPTVAEIQALGGASYQPPLLGIAYPVYSVSVPASGGYPVAQIRTVSSGPNEGLVAYVITMALDVTARRPWGAEVRMRRDVEVALLPVFQFGVFSATDVSYFAGAGFDFGGRVHTNGSLFLASSSPSGLVLHSNINAVKDVIRMQLSNGVDTVSTGRNQPVFIPTAPNGCDGSLPACRNLQVTEGSKAGGPGSADNPNWTNISISTYHGLLVNGRTGAKPLDLPFVAPGLRPIEIIRRPAPGESPGMPVFDSRLYTLAQVRVLISDRSSDLPNGNGARLANVAPYYNAAALTFGATNTAFAEGRGVSEPGGSGIDFIRPPNTSGLPARWPGACAPPRQTDTNCWPLVDGFLLVERRNADGTYTDVTEEWLNLGIARQNPSAILKFQKYRDYTGDGVADVAAPDNDPGKFYPLNLYDTREGEWRDVTAASDAADNTCALGGIMNFVELDVRNLRRWLRGEIGSTGAQTEYASQNGYILYFSDRRGQRDDFGNATGSYGYEDIIDPANANGASGSAPLNPITPNGILDPPEDVNQDGRLETYGAVNIGEGFGVANGNPSRRVACKVPSNLGAADDFARKNRVSGARHALKLVNGAAGNLPATPDGQGGSTVASENPVYIQGNYNADSSGFGSSSVPAAVIADAVTLLSNNWNDLNSFKNPTRLGQGTRSAATTWYRVAVAAGKTVSFPQPTWPGAAQDFGTDGGVHNFLRYIENWSGQTLNYKGSLVSLYYSEQANGAFKCCNTVYSAPVRNYSFDTNFLDPSKLPPGTPRFRDINILGFQQTFTPF